MAANLWFIYALTASIMWGFGYALSEKIIKDIGLQPSFLLFLQGLFTFVPYMALSFFLGSMKPGLDNLMTGWTTILLVIVMCAAIVFGNYLIYMSVSLKNATLASLIEITYPIFTVFFAWLILKENQMNLYTAIGGILIFSGIALIYVKN